MNITVRLFARARDLAGADTLTVQLADQATVKDLRQAIAALHPALAPLLDRSAIGIDNEFADDSQPVPANAEVALLPPVSGGAAVHP